MSRASGPSKSIRLGAFAVWSPATREEAKSSRLKPRVFHMLVFALGPFFQRSVNGVGVVSLIVMVSVNVVKTRVKLARAACAA